MRGVATIAVGAIAGAAALAGCYSPHAATGAPCDPALDNCPSGQRCFDTGEGSFCYSSLPGMLPDGSSVGDGPRPDNAPNCFGTGLVHDLCAIMPSGDLAITANRTINTAMVGGTNCDSIIAQPGGGASLCLVSAQHLSIAAGVTVTATGPNPLVLVGTMGLSIAGTLDASSHHGGGDGPGAQAACGAGTEGGVGGGPSNGAGGGGGGAGGSFGTIGGGGGIGYKSSSGNPGGPGGVPVAPTTPASLTSLVGGCPGGRGGYGHGMPTGGQPSGDGPSGHGGGAIYLITTGTLMISGIVDASGAGGGGGTDGYDSSGGGGGGGAGGFVGLDTPGLSITGAVFANGGGGGGGGGTDIQFHGSPGNDPSSPTTAATGGAGGTGGGGNGGDAFAGPVIAKKGNDGNGQYCAAGGGGGGAGIIRIYGTSASGGTFSPAPN